MKHDAIPRVNLLISTLYFFEGVALLWNPSFWLPIAFVNGADIELDDTHKMFCMFQSGMMFALSAAFCSLDGRKMQTKSLVSGNMLMLFLCLRVHQTIMPFNNIGIGMLAFYGVLLMISYMSAEDTLGPKFLKTKAAQKKNW
eukprot:418168_1